MKQKMIIALLLVAGIVIAAQAALLKTTYLPVVVHQGGNNDPTATGTRTPTQTATPTPTATNTPTPTPTATLTTDPIPTVQVNSMVEIEMTGPSSTGMGSPNPFLIEVEVTFKDPEMQTFAVQGFYDGNGAGGMDGNVWKVRFTPDEPGVWTYTSTSTEPLLEDHSGSFNAINPTGCTPYAAGGLPDFDCVGRLEYSSDHYLRFASGQYWLKGGVNDPEDFLNPPVTVGFTSKEEAIDYLFNKESNSMYILFNNFRGDGSTVYPWVGIDPLEVEQNHQRFDIAKMTEWKLIFDYIQDKGIVLHLVFEDDNSSWTEFDHELYYRQLIARFGHYNGLIWNIAEEFNENYTADQIKDYAQMVSDLDPYDHPLTVHQEGALSIWDPFLGDAHFDLTSFQYPLFPLTLYVHNANAVEWFGKVEASGRTISVSFDEIRYIVPPPYPPDPPLDVGESRHVVWGIYMGGANYELRIWPDDVYSYVDFDPHLSDLQRAREFMEKLPFWQMQPMNSLLEAGQGYVSAKSGKVYSVYLPAGGQLDLDLTGTTETFDGDWFNPRDGSFQVIGSITGGSVQTFTAPSTDDWVLLLK